ncbi:MAG: hypothetical protein H7145_09260 [Akkermansiaceae bacterium]|nr:hypothetical protein [Armatimonadota bacterium]
MKIRWTSGSLRLRISPTELASLERGEPLEERLRIPGAPVGSSWTVLLLPGGTQSEISASGNVVLFDISKADVETLADFTCEGVYCYQSGPGNDSEAFSFYVEKDFPCVHPRPSQISEPDSETFPSPVGFEERKV